MKRMVRKLLLFCIAIWMPWSMIIGFNAGRNLADLVYGDPMTAWQLFPGVVWQITAGWGALLLVAFIAGKLYRWVIRAPAEQPVVQ